MGTRNGIASRRKPPRANGVRRVVVALRMAGVAGQDKLKGVFDYLDDRRRWRLIMYRTKQEFTADVVRSELERGCDGFIAGIPGADDAYEVLAAADVPTVVINVPGGAFLRREKALAFVCSDDAAIGRAGAMALFKQGVYRSYGYAGYRTDDDWSRARGTAYRDALDATGFVGRMFDIDHYKDKVEDFATLSKWLQTLPKPCGIFASCDDRAYEILDACRETGVKVPQDVGVLGVNNDLFLCENAEPKLSSVQPDFVEEGRLAAELLDRMMAGDEITPEGRVRKVGIRAVVHRQSTFPQSGSGLFVQKVMGYIGRKALKGVGVEDVARHFNVSRSMLDQRFRELQGGSVYAAILRLRLEEVKRRLRDTDDTIAEITSACGWENPTPLKALFKKRFGCTMRDYRAGTRS